MNLIIQNEHIARMIKHSYKSEDVNMILRPKFTI
jgi:hypothetical protein